MVVNATTDMKIYREETFGPAMPVFKFKYDEEAIKMANDTECARARGVSPACEAARSVAAPEVRHS